MMRFASVCSIVVLLSMGERSLGDENRSDWTRFGGPSGEFHFREPSWIDNHAPTKRWQRTLGQGMSGVVVQDETLYTCFLAPVGEDEKGKPDSERTHHEVIAAINADNGETLWQYTYDAGWLESQQAFGGRSRATQATPVVCGDRLLTIGFTGIMHCFDRMTGDVVWQKNGVEAYQAVPVQFGFSASPIAMGDRALFLLGGEGGLVCLDVKSGTTIWNMPCGEASYATPVRWQRPDGEQIVFVTRNRVIGVNAECGTPLWEYAMPEQGLTNVPTPLPIDDVGLVISGQGIGGTRRLEISKEEESYEVTQVWESNAQFFYCNWVRHDQVLWGYGGNVLVAIDLATGNRLGRFRGYNDANLLLGDKHLLIFDGEGHLSRLELADRELRPLAKYAVLSERCWTPPTVRGNFMYCRGGDQLLCLDLTGGDRRAAVQPQRIRKQVLAISTSQESEPSTDPIEQITSTYQQSGVDAAMEMYLALRDKDPDSMSFQSRQALAETAKREGLHKFAKLIRQHVSEDFPKQMQNAKRTPSSATSRGDNGLLYIEFAVRNSTQQTIQAYVQGPAKHPFSYGLPLPSGHRRMEKWPVGTMLFETHDGVRRGVLLTVRERFAGQTIDVPTKRTENR